MSKWIVDIHGEIEGDYELICKAESTIPLDKVKKAREEMKDKSCYGCLQIMDKLIESEEIE